MSQVGGKEIRILRSPWSTGEFKWDWTASISLGHFAWTATGAAKTKEEAIAQAEAFIHEIKTEGWQ